MLSLGRRNAAKQYSPHSATLIIQSARFSRRGGCHMYSCGKANPARMVMFLCYMTKGSTYSSSHTPPGDHGPYHTGSRKLHILGKRSLHSHPCSNLSLSKSSTIAISFQYQRFTTHDILHTFPSKVDKMSGTQYSSSNQPANNKPWMKIIKDATNPNAWTNDRIHGIVLFLPPHHLFASRD